MTRHILCTHPDYDECDYRTSGSGCMAYHEEPPEPLCTYDEPECFMDVVAA
jgi:hypothetical protein